jgi:hypothetical protein
MRLLLMAALLATVPACTYNQVDEPKLEALRTNQAVLQGRLEAQEAEMRNVQSRQNSLEQRVNMWLMRK